MSLSLGPYQQEINSELHKDRLLTSFGFESFDVCETCLVGKMTESPFTGKGENPMIF